MLINPVAVEKVGFSEKSRKSGDRKCLADWGKSFVELPDAKQFLRIRGERVFQQPLLFAPPISKWDKLRSVPKAFPFGPSNSKSHVSPQLACSQVSTASELRISLS